MTTELTENDRLLITAAINLIQEYSVIMGNASCNDYAVPNTPFNWEIWKDIERQIIEDNYIGEDYDEMMAGLEVRPKYKTLDCMDITWAGEILGRLQELAARGKALPISAPLSVIEAETGEG